MQCSVFHEFFTVHTYFVKVFVVTHFIKRARMRESFRKITNLSGKKHRFVVPALPAALTQCQVLSPQGTLES